MPSANHGPNGQSLIRRWHINGGVDRDWSRELMCELVAFDPTCDPIRLGTFPTIVSNSVGEVVELGDFPMYFNFVPRTLSQWAFLDVSENGPWQEHREGLQLLVGFDHEDQADPRAKLSPSLDNYPRLVLALVRGSPKSDSVHKPGRQSTDAKRRPFPIYCPDDESTTSIGAAACALLAMFFENNSNNIDWGNVNSMLKADKGSYALSWSGDLDFIILKIKQQGSLKQIFEILVVVFSGIYVTVEEYFDVHARLSDASDNVMSMIELAVKGRPENMNGAQLPYATVFMSFVE